MTNARSFGRIICNICGKSIDAPAEVASLQSGLCPECDSPRQEKAEQGVSVFVSAPEAIKGAT
jgi:NMD protein affecting ribosome stability and mRNA decay